MKLMQLFAIVKIQETDDRVGDGYYSVTDVHRSIVGIFEKDEAYKVVPTLPTRREPNERVYYEVEEYTLNTIKI